MQALQSKKSKIQQPLLNKKQMELKASKRQQNTNKILSNWEETKLHKEKLSNPISVPSHYEKYQMEE